jgi:hypothetical protein
MRIAACFSGTPRQFKSCHKTFMENIAQGHDVDVFISTWDSRIRHFKKQVADEGSLKELIKLYQPVGQNVEVYDQKKREKLYMQSRMGSFQNEAQGYHKCRGNHRKEKCRFCGTVNIHNQIGQLYNIWKSNYLKIEHEKLHDFKYDLVIRTRFDNYHVQKIDFNGLNNGSIWVPYGYDDFPQYGGGVNDQFAVGTSEAMDVYSSMYRNMYEYAMKHCYSEEGYGVPHRTILDAAEEGGVKDQRNDRRRIQGTENLKCLRF